MFTASVTNNNLVIYTTATVTGVNTNYIFVFDNNVFQTISTYTFSGSLINITLADSVDKNGLVKVNIFGGGVTTTVINIATSILATNGTIYFDNTQPSFLEMIENNSYNYTSFVYSNYITGITTQSNFPTTSLIVKRNPPDGNITINEGYLGSMYVHRFVGLSSTLFGINSSGNTFESKKGFAFDYNSYADQLVKSISFNITPVNEFLTNSKAYITINQDYFNSPSPISLGVSTVIDFSDVNVGETYKAVFTFSTSVTLNEDKYWIIFTPTIDSSFSENTSILLEESEFANLYTGLFYESEDNVVFTSTSDNGVTFEIETERGIAIPTVDSVFNQLDEPQAVDVEYGDATDLSVYTTIATPNTNHYIKKSFLDESLIYAVEVLADSFGQNQYEVIAKIGSLTSSYFTMIANELTTNIVRYELYNPTNLTSLKLVSLGDYYAQSPQGTVLVSATDFIGIATVEISASSDFSPESTTTIILTPPQQKYIDNLNYDFGDLGKKFSLSIDEVGGPINKIYAVNVSGARNYLLITDNVIYLYDNDETITVVKTITDANFVSSSLGTNGIIITDTLGRIYNYSSSSVTTIGSVIGVPLSVATKLTHTYIGVATNNDVTRASYRKRIYILENNVLTHQSWSTQIPEPQITFIYSTSFGLIVGAYNQDDLVGKLYIYNNDKLTQVYSTYLRPDFALYSSYTSNLYVGFSGSEILAAKYSDGSLGGFNETNVNLSGDIIRDIQLTRVQGKIFVVTNLNSYIFDESTFVTTLINTPSYNTGDQTGLSIKIQNLDLGITNYESTFITQTYSALSYDPTLNGYTSVFRFQADGFLVFNGISTLGYTTSFYLNVPNNSTIEYIKFNNRSLSTTVFSGIFYPSVPKGISISILGAGVTGIGTISLHQGFNSTATLVGIASLTPTKTLNCYTKTGTSDDIFGFEDGSLRTADVSELTQNQYKVYARFTDVIGNVNTNDTVVSDVIYNQLQQQINGQSLPTGRIVGIDVDQNITSFTPSDGQNGFIYAGSKIVRQTGVFESDPFYAADVTSWDIIQVVAEIPGVTPDNANEEHGTSIKLEVKTAYSVLDLSEAVYVNSYELSTINNGNDYSSYAAISANISSLSGTWLQFKLTLVTATANVSPIAKSVLITYNGAGKSVFITKTFDAAIQSSIVPTPKIRRGILTANFVTNEGIVSFGYTTDPDDGNPSNYALITPNQIFTLDEPSEKIKFGVILKTASSIPCFFDEFAVQLDLGPNDVYFMPPQAYFEAEQYYNSQGVAVTRAYRFVNKSVGIISSYTWSFGTTSAGITTYYPPNEDGVAGPAINRQNPVIGFSNTGPFIIGLFITGFIQDGVIFNSELYTRSFIAT